MSLRLRRIAAEHATRPAEAPDSANAPQALNSPVHAHEEVLCGDHQLHAVQGILLGPSPASLPAGKWPPSGCPPPKHAVNVLHNLSSPAQNP